MSTRSPKPFSTLTSWLPPTRVQEHATAQTRPGFRRVAETAANWQDHDGLTVDEANHVIKGVKIVGCHGKNFGRQYPQRVLEARKSLYEGKPVNINHLKPDEKTRNADDRFGWIQNVHTVPGKEGLFGDLKYNPKHERAEKYLFWAKNNPRMIGLSPDHAIEEYPAEGGGREVRDISHVYAVDIVADPSTTDSLTEAAIMDPTMMDGGAVEATDEPMVPAATDTPEPMDEVGHLRESCCKMIEKLADMGMLRDLHEKLDKMANGGDEAMEATDEQDGAMAPGNEKTQDKDVEKEKKNMVQEATISDAIASIAKDPKNADFARVFEAFQIKFGAMEETNKKLASENARIIAERDRERTQATRAQEAVRLCDEAKLPSWARGPVFMRDLANANASRRKELITETVRVVESARADAAGGRAKSIPREDVTSGKVAKTVASAAAARTTEAAAAQTAATVPAHANDDLGTWIGSLYSGK